MSLLDSILFSPRRSIGTIIPNVVVEEQHRDDVTITDHPVEKGATVSDHAFMRPAVIEMRCAWSDTDGGEGSVQGVYEELLQLQRMREPFDVVTGKRMYQNMLLSSIGVTTDERSETALMVTAQIREVIIVSTQSTGGSSGATGDQKMPQATAATSNAGSKQMSMIESGGTSRSFGAFGLGGASPIATNPFG